MVDENPYDSPTAESRTPIPSSRQMLLRASEFIRTIARSASFSTFAVTLVGFLFYPRPWGSHWSAQKRITYALINLGGACALISLLICVVACCFIPWTRTRKQRPLWSAFAVNAASIAMTLLTPGV